MYSVTIFITVAGAFNMVGCIIVRSYRPVLPPHYHNARFATTIGAIAVAVGGV